jgi:chromosome segregation ATPase
VTFPSGSFIALSSSSGIWDEDYHVIKSIKTMNPNRIDKTHHAEEAKLRRGEKFVESIQSTGDIMHQNRLKYDNLDDLVNKLNSELANFSVQSQALETMIMISKISQNATTQDHEIDLEKLHLDIEGIIKDFFVLEKMFDTIHSRISSISKKKPVDVQQIQQQRTQEEIQQIAELERTVQNLSQRTEDLKQKINKEQKKKLDYKSQLERKNRKALAEEKLRSKGQLPSKFLTPELREKIETTQYEMKQRATGGSWLKSIIVWLFLIAIIAFAVALWRNLSENEQKFKD